MTRWQSLTVVKNMLDETFFQTEQPPPGIEAKTLHANETYVLVVVQSTKEEVWLMKKDLLVWPHKGQIGNLVIKRSVLNDIAEGNRKLFHL